MQASRPRPEVGSSETELRRPTCSYVQVITEPARHKREPPERKLRGRFYRNGKGCVACQKSPTRTFLTASTAERFELVQNAASPEKPVNTVFSAAGYCTRGGPVSLRLGHGAALICHRHIIHYRAAASLPLEHPRCSFIFTFCIGFLTVSHPRQMAGMCL